jgi:hypothetical protein
MDVRRLRWLTDGQHQRAAKLHELLRSSHHRNCVYGHSVCDLSSRPDGRCTVCLDCRLAGKKTDDLRGDHRSHPRDHRHGDSEDTTYIYWRQIPAGFLCNTGVLSQPAVPRRDCTATVSGYIGWTIQYVLLLRSYPSLLHSTAQLMVVSGLDHCHLSRLWRPQAHLALESRLAPPPMDSNGVPSCRLLRHPFLPRVAPLARRKRSP